MNSRIAKTLTAIAATFAAFGAWAYVNGQDWIGCGEDTLFSNQANWQGGRATDSTVALRFDGQAGKTVTFDDVYGNTEYLWIGSTSADTYITDVENWTLNPIVWEVTESTNGLNKTGGDFLIADAANQYGALRIKSGTYTVSGKVHIGKAGKADLTIDGGMFTANSEFNVGISGATARFTMNGGTLNIGATSYWGADANTVATATIYTNAVLNLNGTGGNTSLSMVNNSGSITLNVVGGTVTAAGDMYVGEKGSGTATLNISNGGVMTCGSTAERWFKIGGGSTTGTVNLEEGGTLEAWYIGDSSSGTASLNFNGGTLVALGAASNGLIGNASGTLAVTVGEAGGTIDTNGKSVTISKEIGGTGTLTITGGGTVTFSAAPTCGLNVEEGVAVLPTGATPASLEFGTNGFVKFDLSSVSATTEDDVTTLPDAQTLATVATSVTLPDGDTIVEHVIIKNDNTLAWIASCSGTTLTATPELAAETTATVTVWTGDVTGTWAGAQGDSGKYTTTVQNWTSGKMGSTKKVIVPFADSLYLGVCGVNQCDEMVLKTTGDVRIFNRSQNKTDAQWNYTTFRASRISGDGTLRFGGVGIDTSSAGPACTIDVPLVFEKWTHYLGSGAYDADWTAYLKGASATYPLTVNKKVTVPSGVTGRIEANVFLNGDLEVGGTLTFNTTQNLQGAISGSGTINGSFTTAAGAKVCATITNANATAEHLTVTGDANLSNATLEISGGERVADAPNGNRSPQGDPDCRMDEAKLCHPRTEQVVEDQEGEHHG